MTKEMIVTCALGLIVLLGISVRLFCVLERTPAISPDEEAHYNYARYINIKGGLPQDQLGYGVSMSNYVPYFYENYQQPLYYVIAAPFASSLEAARLFTCALWLISVIALYRLTHNLIITAFMSLAPSMIFITSFVTNDAMMILASILAALSLRSENKLMIGISCLLLGMTKASGIAIVGAIVLYAIIKQRNWLIYTLPAFAASIGMFLARFYLESANTTVWSISPARALDIVVTALATIIIPDNVTANMALCAVLGAAVCWYVWYQTEWDLLKVLIVGSVGAVLVLFCLSHVHVPGRLLLCAIPFCLIPRVTNDMTGAAPQ